MTRTLPDNQPNTPANFSTYDLGCAAALISAGFMLSNLDATNPRKVLFVFGDEPAIQTAVNDYFSDQLTVNARTFFDNVKMIKNRIYSGA
jgi:hypothetical protein